MDTNTKFRIVENHLGFKVQKLCPRYRTETFLSFPIRIKQDGEEWKNLNFAGHICDLYSVTHYHESEEKATDFVRKLQKGERIIEL